LGFFISKTFVQHENGGLENKKTTIGGFYVILKAHIIFTSETSKSPIPLWTHYPEFEVCPPPINHGINSLRSSKSNLLAKMQK
jgi:hypothetical protein